MKISASIYSDKKRPLKEVISDLVEHQVDLLHVDCNDDPSVFDDIASIRQWCNLPIDLHLITEKPEKYFELLRANPVEYLTFQHEDLTDSLQIPNDITGKKGIAITTPTDVDVFDSYSSFDFILIMATVPGQSGGVFDRVNFDKIRKFRKKYPSKSIHVDGGVNAEVSFILRNMGVTSSVSGSYLFNAPSVGFALMQLTKMRTGSHFHVEDFMTPLGETPVVYPDNLELKNVLQTIEDGQLGFCLVADRNDDFIGLISNADVRKGLLKNINNLAAFSVAELINRNPISILDKTTVLEMLQVVKKCVFPVSYLPVLNSAGKVVGIVNFANLVKGEL